MSIDDSLVPIILSPYFKEISQLNEELRNKETQIEFYSLKAKKLNQELDEKREILEKEERELSLQFISTVESEDFFKNPSDENVEVINEIKRKKNKFNADKGNYIRKKAQIDRREKDLAQKVSQLPPEKKELYDIICKLILQGDDNVILDDEEAKIIKNNQGLVRVISSKCSRIKGSDSDISPEKSPENSTDKSRKNSNNNIAIGKGNDQNFTITSIKNSNRNSNRNSLKNQVKKPSNYSTRSNKNNISNSSRDDSRKKGNNKETPKVIRSARRNDSRKKSHDGLMIKTKSRGSFANPNRMLTPKLNDTSSVNTSDINSPGKKSCMTVCGTSVYDKIPFTNKSFYLLRNANIAKTFKNPNEINQDDLGGEHCCERLLRNYQNEIRSTSHSPFRRNDQSKARSQSYGSYVDNLRKERQYKKFESMPKIKVRGKVVNQTVIGQATNTENGIIESYINN